MSALPPEHDAPTGFDGPAALTDGSFTVCRTGPRPGLSTVRPVGRAGEARTLPGSAAAGATPWLDGAVLVADPVDHALVAAHPAGARVVWQDDAMSQPNDLVALDDHRVLCTDPDWAGDTGRLWLVDLARQDAAPLGGRMGTTNGIAVDRTRGRLYLTESTQRRLLAADLASALDGAPSWEVVRDFTDGLPDGIAVDGAGRVLVTVHGTGTLHAVDPDTAGTTSVALQGPACTNVAVGGPTGHDVLVTFSGRPGLQWLRWDALPLTDGERP